MAAPKAPLLDGGKTAKDVTLDEAVFGAEVKPHLVHETVRAELNDAPSGHARGEEPRARLRRPREAVAPEGHRPRPRGHDPRPAVDGRRRRFPPTPRDFEVKVNRKARALRCAARSQRPRRRRARLRCSTARRSTRRRRRAR